jgi:hypothetical protein
VVAGMAGTGTWLAYLTVTLGMLFVASNIGVLARRHPMAGWYFVHISRTLGPLAGMTTGSSMILAYTATGIAIAFGNQIFLGNKLRSLDLGAGWPVAGVRLTYHRYRDHRHRTVPPRWRGQFRAAQPYEPSSGGCGVGPGVHGIQLRRIRKCGHACQGTARPHAHDPARSESPSNRLWQQPKQFPRAL